MASSSATTRSAASRSPSTKAAVPSATASVVSDARRTTSSSTSSMRSRICGSDCGGEHLRGDHSDDHEVRPVGARARAVDCFPAVHLRSTTRPRSRYAVSVRMRRDDIHRSRREHPDAKFVRTPLRARARSAGAAGPRDRHRLGGPPTTNKLASATLNGDGSTFQLGFNQVVIGAFKPIQKAVTINYQGNGSGQGRTDFANQVVDFAGTDAPYKATDPQPKGGAFFYFPTVVAPITVSYNVRREGPEALGRHHRQDLPGSDHDVGRPRDQDRQPEGQAAEHDDHGGAPLRRLGHDRQLHQLPREGGPGVVDAGYGLDRAVALGHPGCERELGRRQPGARAPTVRSATSTSPTPTRAT